MLLPSSPRKCKHYLTHKSISSPYLNSSFRDNSCKNDHPLCSFLQCLGIEHWYWIIWYTKILVNQIYVFEEKENKLNDLKWPYVKTDVDLIMPLMNRMLTKSVENVRTTREANFTTNEKKQIRCKIVMKIVNTQWYQTIRLIMDFIPNGPCLRVCF